MSIPVFPPELPKPERDSFNFGHGDARRPFEPDSGPLAMRNRFSRVPDVVAMTLTVDRSQRARFERFYFEDLGRGTLPFIMPDPTTEGWPVLLPNGQPMLTARGTPVLMAKKWLVMFASDGLPGFTMVGVEFRYTFNLSVMP